MTPSAFSKLGLRLLALHIGLFTALPQLGYWIPSATDTQSLPFLLPAIFTAGMAIGLWVFADRILDIILPIRVSREIPPNYPRLQGLVLMFVGGLLVFDGLHRVVYPWEDVGVIPQWPLFVVLGLALFCEPAWRRRH